MRVVVVGAGVVGLCSAWFLKKDGHEVTVMDRGRPDGDRCSLGNSGIIVPSHFIPLSAPGMVASGLKMLARRDGPFRIKPSLDPDLARWCLLFARHCTKDHVEQSAPLLLDMHLRSKELFIQFASDFGNEFGLQHKGMLMVCRTESGLNEEREVAEHARVLGLQAVVLEGRDIGKVESSVRIEALGAVHFADDCHVAPHVFVRRLQNELTAMGVTFQWDTDLQGWDGADQMSTSSGGQTADAFVIAAGSWSGKIAKMIGLDLPLQPGKGLNVSLESPSKCPETPMLLKEARIAVTPMAGGLRFGGTMELGEWDLVPDSVRAGAMLSNVPTFLPDFQRQELEGHPVWTGLRPCSPDGLPYIGRTTRAERVLFATGHGMMGLSLGPITGKLVADELAGRSTVDVRLSPDRFDR